MDSLIKLAAVGKKDPKSSTKTWEWDHKGRSNISKIYLSYGGTATRVWGMQFLYAADETRSRRLFGCCIAPSPPIISEPVGNMAKGHFRTINLNYPKEYITKVVIYVQDNGGFGIEIKTNLCNLFGPFPESSNKTNYVQYLFEPDDQFGGFHGTIDQDSSLASIGVYVGKKNMVKYDANLALATLA